MNYSDQETKEITVTQNRIAESKNRIIDSLFLETVVCFSSDFKSRLRFSQLSRLEYLLLETSVTTFIPETNSK